jgi:hypothetical protein
MASPQALTLRRPSFIQWSGLAALLGSTFVIVEAITHVLTHGTTSYDLHAIFTILGLTSKQYQLAIIPTTWFLFLIAVFGLNALQRPGATRSGQVGFILSALGYALAALGWILQLWIVDVDANFYSVPVQGGFLLWLLSTLIQSIGMTIFGVVILWKKTLPQWAAATPLLIGFLLIPTAGHGLFGLSDGSAIWNVIYVLLQLPYALCWALLGIALWSASQTE